MDIFDKLNPMQCEAVKHTDGALLILAGAGSGKTRVLTHRIAYLISLGVRPFNILAITFTNKAAREMRERTNSICPEGSDVWVSTFHSLCVRLLRRDISKLGMDGSFTIYDADDSERLLKRCIKEMNVNDKLYPVKTVQYQISDWKNKLVTPDEAARKSVMDYRHQVMSEIYTIYQKKLKESNALDFDDIIFKTIELFTARPDVLEKYQDRFRYIMVDEYQDTNAAQYELVRKLANKHGNICVVGDDDQSIYGWRGADIRNILDFEKDYNNTKVIKLEQNYRSTKVILDSANSVIANNTNRKEKALWTESEGGGLIKYNRTSSDFDEAAYVVNTIKDGVGEGKAYCYSDYAVLYRNNAQSRLLEDQFVRNDIPYRLLGGVRFYERREVKDVLAYLKLIHNPLDEISLLRIINVPRRGIGDSSINKIAVYAAEHDIPIFSALTNLGEITALGSRTAAIARFVDLVNEFIELAKNNPISELLNIVLDKTNYLSELELENTEEARNRIENVNELRSKAIEFESNAEDKTLGAFLEEIALVADIDAYEENENAVVLMTLHSSKGLEFKNVFITGFEEGLFPSYRSIMSDTLNSIEEERRLCYVGITRAKENLYITSAEMRMQNGQMNYNSVSRFFKELPKGCVEDAKKRQKDKKEIKPSKNAAISDIGMAQEHDGLKIEPVKPKTKVSNVIEFKQRVGKVSAKLPIPKGDALDFGIGDKVMQSKYGIGVVLDIRSAGADYEVTIDFADHGVKKFMARLAKLKKV